MRDWRRIKAVVNLLSAIQDLKEDCRMAHRRHVEMHKCGETAKFAYSNWASHMFHEAPFEYISRRRDCSKDFHKFVAYYNQWRFSGRRKYKQKFLRKLAKLTDRLLEEVELRLNVIIQVVDPVEE